jgi:hypothetical protein
MEVGPLRVDGDVTSSATPDRGTDLVGRVETTPFDHVYLEDLFPPEYYRRLRT